LKKISIIFFVFFSKKNLGSIQNYFKRGIFNFNIIRENLFKLKFLSQNCLSILIKRCIRLDSQIIISREDNTDFVSLGYIQTDTSLVAALGGALASFAEEIGLTNNKTTEDRFNSINFSRFQNGILASKMVKAGEQTPIILIAIKDFEGEDKELDFIVEYAELTAKAIVDRFIDEYTSIGIVPKIEEAIDVIISTANSVYKKSGDKIRIFTKSFKPKITDLLNKLWENQNEFEKWAQSYASGKLSTLTQKELQHELARYFYIQGMKSDALFPLFFASNVNPLNEIVRIIDHFLVKKATIARKEITDEVEKIANQLKDSSKALSKRGSIEIQEVELVNEAFIFEKILVTKPEKLPDVVNDLLTNCVKDLYRKLFRKYPLNFVAMSKEVVFDKNELDDLFRKTINSVLLEELKDQQWIIEKLFNILREVTSKYSSSEVMKKEKQLLNNIYDEFINTLKKEHPFIPLADSSFEKLEPIIRKQSSESLERFRTSLDEAVILYNIIGQTHSSLSNDKNQSVHDLMILYFLESIIEPYQLREVPDMVYTLIAECLEKTFYGRRYKPEEIVENSINQFENKIQFKIIPETKKLVLKRIAKAKPSLQRFENFENLTFFFRSFRTSLETTLARILQTIFGPEKLPTPPNDLIRMIEKFVAEIQSIFILIQLIEKISRRPGGRELFSSEVIKFLERNTKFKHILPNPLELARVAYESGWFKPLDQKKQTNLSDLQLKSLRVKISFLNIEGTIDSLLKNPCVLEKLWVKYATDIIEKRQSRLKKLVAEVEKKTKVSAGDTTGKKKFSLVLKKLKDISKTLTSVVAGGGIMRKLFVGSKELNQLSQEVLKSLIPILKFSPDQYEETVRKQLVTNSNINSGVIPSDFQDLMTTYASLWVADSKYIDTIENKFFWDGIISKLTVTNGKQTLENKISQNLKSVYKKEGISRAQKRIIRQTIVEETVPIFNQLIRSTLEIPFIIFNNLQIIEFDEKQKEWYISFGKLNIPPNHLQTILNSIENLHFVKDSNNLTEVRFMLTDYSSQKRAKDSQSVEVFLRRALFIDLSKKEFKALEFFSELNERYVGKSAADTFYSNFRSLAQIIISPME